MIEFRSRVFPLAVIVHFHPLLFHLLPEHTWEQPEPPFVGTIDMTGYPPRPGNVTFGDQVLRQPYEEAISNEPRPLLLAADWKESSVKLGQL